jgi:ankyrin repeat protein
MKRRRALLLSITIVIALCAACGVWLYREQRQYTLNQQLIAALDKGDTKTALVLVNTGADPNTRYSPHPAPSLQRLLNLFLHHTPAPTNDRPTALMFACCGGFSLVDPGENLPLLQAMLAHGANVNAKMDKDTPLHFAAQWVRLRTMELLLQHGADVNAQNEQGYTPLMCAVEGGGTVELVHSLLMQGANPNIQAKDGRTPLYLVVLSGDNRGIIPELLAHGANPNLRGINDSTLLQLAQEMKRPDLVRLLKQHGAK